MNDNKKKYVLMLKFLLPFAAFIIVIVVALMLYFIPRYEREFALEIESNMYKNETSVTTWLNYYYSQIEVLASYCKYETDYTQMLDSFKELESIKEEIKNIHFSGTVSYKDGGLLVIVYGDNIEGFDQTTREWYIEAVKNAIKYDYSNGLTEGFNNKTKVIKRVMYGRCSFDLLRLKILA